MTPESKPVVSLPWYEQTPHNPPLEGEGLALSIPHGLEAGGVRVYGTVRLSAARLEELNVPDRHPVRTVVLGAVLSTGDSFVGNAWYGALLFPAPEGDMITEYFAVNLAEAIGLPDAQKVFVFASAGTFVTEPQTLTRKG